MILHRIPNLKMRREHSHGKMAMYGKQDTTQVALNVGKLKEWLCVCH